MTDKMPDPDSLDAVIERLDNEVIAQREQLGGDIGAWASSDGGRIMASDLSRLIEAYREALEKYDELIFQVAKKVPGETRHETAKRIIHEHENCAILTAHSRKETGDG